jgi:cell wall-associated NlpC family hydrolase
VTTLDKRLHAYRDDLADLQLKGQVEAARFVDGTPAQVVTETAPQRRVPEPGTQLSSELLFGEAVTVFENADGFAWVQNQTDGYVGYTDSAALSDTVHAPTHRVAAIHTCVYGEPHVRSPGTMPLPICAPVTVIGTKGRYAELATGGWVPAQHLAELDNTESDYVAVADRFMGAPYVWGGRSDRGLDCSALVQLSLMRCGIDAPRDSDMQEAGLGSPGPYNGNEDVLQRGDLVFWKGHVGIWIAPERFLHANAMDMCVSTAPFQDIVRYIQENENQPVSSVRRV